jgi:hypothetical protein
MDRRAFLGRTVCAVAAGGGLIFAGCRGTSATVMKDNKTDMVGNCAAGAETFKPLIDECVCKLLGKESSRMPTTPGGQPVVKRICFVGLQNQSSEELGDFKAQIVEIIDTRINNSGTFVPISQHFVDAGLRAARVRPEDLFVPANQKAFQGIMEQQNSPFDYLLFAKLTSGTTRSGSDFQRDYRLSLELVDLRSGISTKEEAHLRKGYANSLMGKIKNG